MKLEFRIRDSFWLVIVFAIACGWWIDHSGQAESVAGNQETIEMLHQRLDALSAVDWHLDRWWLARTKLSINRILNSLISKDPYLPDVATAESEGAESWQVRFEREFSKPLLGHGVLYNRHNTTEANAAFEKTEDK